MSGARTGQSYRQRRSTSLSVQFTPVPLHTGPHSPGYTGLSELDADIIRPIDEADEQEQGDSDP